MCMAASMRCPALCSLACRRRCDSLTSSSTSAPAASSHSQAPVVRESRQRHCVRKAGRDRHLVPIPLWRSPDQRRCPGKDSVTERVTPAYHDAWPQASWRHSIDALSTKVHVHGWHTHPIAGAAYLMDNVVNVTINLAHGHTEGRLSTRERDFSSIAGLPPTLRMENGRRQQQKSRFEGNLGDGSLVCKPETKKTKIASARKRDCVGMTHFSLHIAQRHPASIHGSAGG